jgi:hypothetical protein
MRKRSINPNGTLIQDEILTRQQLPTNRPIVQLIRQSTKRQQKQNSVSAEMQDADMRRFLIANGWNEKLILPPIDDDSGRSGTKGRFSGKRPGLERLYRLIETDQIGAIATYNVSRIYRVLSKAETGTFCDEVLKHGITIVTKRRVYWPNKNDNKALADDFQAAADYIDDHIKGVVIAAKNFHIETDTSYGGGYVPFGYLVEGMGLKMKGLRKFYRIYEAHARLVRWLFRRFRELGGNLPLLARELKEIDFRFPPFEPDITPYVALKSDPDGSYPLRTRDAIISILTNRAYIGQYVYGGVLVSETAHEPLIPIDDFMFAWDRLSNVSLDGSEQKERVQRERRYGGATALLDGIVRSGENPVYVVSDSYTARVMNDGFHRDDLVVSVDTLDSAFARAMVTALARLERARRNGLNDSLYERITALQMEQERQAKDFSKALARIDKEIRGQEMAQRISREEGDEEGYRQATKQLVGLRRDKAALEAKTQQADSEAGELAECHGLIDCAVSQWEAMPVQKRKRLVKLLVESANLIEAAPHFLRLDVVLASPINLSLSVHIHRAYGARQPWNDQEDDTLYRMYPQASKEAILRSLPTHTWTAIVQRAMAKGIKREVVNGRYAIPASLSYADVELMEQAGACTEKPVWSVNDVIQPGDGACQRQFLVAPDRTLHKDGM